MKNKLILQLQSELSNVRVGNRETEGGSYLDGNERNSVSSIFYNLISCVCVNVECF